MMMGQRFYIFIAIYCSLMTIVISVNADVCPNECVCKRIKYLINLDGYKVQCGTSTHKLTSLEEIDLSEIASEILQLDLNKNKISTLESSAFQNFTALRRLDLSSNSLKRIDKQWFNGLIHLEKLKLGGNLISTISRGTFDYLLSLKQLDISNNPLTCDCELLWLLDWLQNTSVKLATSPKCAAPASLKDHLLRKIKVGVEIHCKSPITKNADIELKPNHNQVLMEGDSFKLRCRAPSVTADTLGDEHLSSARISWKFNLNDVKDLFNDTAIENHYLADSGLLESILTLSVVNSNHTGEWTCHLISDKEGNHSKTTTLFVLSNSTKYCASSVTIDNKGTYVWPRTITDNVVQFPCVARDVADGNVYATYYCSEFATWKYLNTSVCPYTSEVTRILEQYSKVNLNLTNASESIRHLKNYTMTKSLLNDKMDVVFVARTLANYLDVLRFEKELGAGIVEIISAMLMYNRKLLEDAHLEDKSLTRLRRIVERVAEYTPSPQLQKTNLAAENFRVKAENFNGLTCTWYVSGDNGQTASRQFYCTTSTHFPYTMLEDALIEASIQIPASLFLQLMQQGHNLMSSPSQLVIAMYGNGNFFPSYQTKDVISSSVIGANLLDLKVENLSDGIKIMYRFPLHEIDDGITPRLVWWDDDLHNGLGGWTNQNNACMLFNYVHDTLIFSCNRLGYFGILQNVRNLYNGKPGLSLYNGAKFRYAHATVYIGSSILIISLYISTITYILCYDSIQMPRKTKHALINTWISIILLVYIFTMNIYQTEDVKFCQIVGLSLHYFSLSVCFWMCVSIVMMYKHLIKQHGGIGRNTITGISGMNGLNPIDAQINGGVSVQVRPIPSEDEFIDDFPPTQKSILGLYLAGYGISLIICGLSAAINLKEYASFSYCFLYSTASLSSVFVPSFIAIVCFVVYTLMIKCMIQRIDVHGQLSEGTQATENVDLELLEPGYNNSNRSSTTSINSLSRIDDPEHSPNAQLKATAISMIFYISVWFSGALTCRKIRHLNAIGIFNEQLFSVIYCVISSIFGLFILFFYCIARNDVRTSWSTLKQSRKYRVSDTNMIPQLSRVQSPQSPRDSPNPGPQMAPNVRNGDFLNAHLIDYSNMSIIQSRSSSRTSRTSNRSTNGMLKNAVDLNVNLTDPNAEAKIANVNLVVLHRQQYRNGQMVDNEHAELFYNPHQSTVARKFFKKQRRKVLKNNLSALAQRRCHGSSLTMSDTTHEPLKHEYEVCGGFKSEIKMTNKNRESINATCNLLRTSNPKISNTNIHNAHVDVDKLQNNRKYEWETGDMGQMNHPVGKMELADRVTQKHLSSQDRKLDGTLTAIAGAINVGGPPSLTHTRTVSQQCSLEYSSCSSRNISDGELIDGEFIDCGTIDDVDSRIDRGVYNRVDGINSERPIEDNVDSRVDLFIRKNPNRFDLIDCSIDTSLEVNTSCLNPLNPFDQSLIEGDDETNDSDMTRDDFVGNFERCQSNQLNSARPKDVTFDPSNYENFNPQNDNPFMQANESNDNGRLSDIAHVLFQTPQAIAMFFPDDESTNETARKNDTEPKIESKSKTDSSNSNSISNDVNKMSPQPRTSLKNSPKIHGKSESKTNSRKRQAKKANSNSFKSFSPSSSDFDCFDHKEARQSRRKARQSSRQSRLRRANQRITSSLQSKSVSLESGLNLDSRLVDAAQSSTSLNGCQFGSMREGSRTLSMRFGNDGAEKDSKIETTV